MASTDAAKEQAAPEEKMVVSPHAPDLKLLEEFILKAIKSCRWTALVTSIVALVSRMLEMNTELNKKLAGLTRKRPRSETMNRVKKQLKLFESNDEPKSDANAEPKPEGKEKPKKKRRRPRRPAGRPSFPAHLERVPEENPVPDGQRKCPCGLEMGTVGHTICETLELVPAKIVVIQRKDETVSCKHDNTIRSAAPPPQIVERGVLGPVLIIEAVVDKFVLHLPTERQCRNYRWMGVSIAPQTLGRSMGAAIDLVATPIAKLIRERTREGVGVLATDATGIPVLDPTAPGGIRYSTMWCWVNADWISFDYRSHGKASGVKSFLAGCDEDDPRLEGLLQSVLGLNAAIPMVQCDGTNILDFVERAGAQRPGCWSHARRGLVKAARGGDLPAIEGIEIISQLFGIDKASREAGDSTAQRLSRRQCDGAPVTGKLLAWVDDMLPTAVPKSPFGRALGYIKRQWKRLVLFLEDGRIPLTNNHVEREIRRLVLGVKSWLFTWQDTGGERVADILTVIASCIAHRIDPRAYLHLVTRLILDGWAAKRFSELLPHQLAVSHPELQLLDGRQEEEEISRLIQLRHAPAAEAATT